jgi:hypothetical protein
MRNNKIKILILTLVITIVFLCNSIGGNFEDPEIIDDIGDTGLSYLDIESAWFYENPDEPEYLYTAIKLKDLKENFNAVFSIRWTYNEIDYISGVDTFYIRDTVFRSGRPYRASYWQWKQMPICEGDFDQETGIITWRILKSNIGNPQKDDILTNTRAHAVPGFPISFVYFILGRDVRDFAPDAYDEFGQDYIIKY